MASGIESSSVEGLKPATLAARADLDPARQAPLDRLVEPTEAPSVNALGADSKAEPALHSSTNSDTPPTDSPKLFEETIQNGTATYHIAYRAATLIPASKAATTVAYDSSTVSSVRVVVKDGRTAPKNIVIHAEDLYIYAGTDFDFRGKTVTLNANRIFCVPAMLPLPQLGPPSTGISSKAVASGTASVSALGTQPNHTLQIGPADTVPIITIDISGRDSAVRRWPVAAPGTPGSDFELLWQAPQWIIGRPRDFVPPPAGVPWGSPGAPGADGIHGNNGLAGGQLTLKAVQLLSLLDQTADGTVANDAPDAPAPATGGRCTLFIDNAGGKGSIGQQGGQGGKGGSLIIPDTSIKAPQNPPNNSATYVGAGGNAGRGGDAGKWGAFGITKVYISQRPPAVGPGKPTASTADSEGLNIGTPQFMFPRIAQGGLPGTYGPRGTVAGASAYGMNDGDSALGVWPAAHGASADAGASAREGSGRGAFDTISAVEAAQIIEPAYLAMVVSRLQAEWPIVAASPSTAGSATNNSLLRQRADFVTSVTWLAGELDMVRKANRKFTGQDEGLIQQVESAVGNFEKKTSHWSL
ncbi:hypothetical protein CCMA1212_009988 [Trichoderma ghanense]|uniref:Uncharacterized protein n=1 Tax=Trichoderma ghanense TaxID=65468 RepID=A0ABY2GQU7_9HYPO